jgi:hypothetical protein
MRDPIKLRDSIIIGGLQYNRETIVDRSILKGTRFDSPEYCIERDEPEFHEPAWNDRVEVSTEVEQEITGGPEDPMLERIVRKAPKPRAAEIVRPRFPNDSEVVEEIVEEEEEIVRPPKKVFVKKKLTRRG